MRIGVSPILTRQLCAAMFALSGHIFFAICLALGLLQVQPERSSPRKVPVVHVHLQAARQAAKPADSVPRLAPVQPVNTDNAIPAAQPQTTDNANPPVPPQTTDSANLSAQSRPASDNKMAAQKVDVPNQPIGIGSLPSQPVATAERPIPGAAAAVAAIDIPYYYSLKQLTEKPRVVEDATTNMNLVLPGVETQNVILRLLINEQGAIDQVEIEHSTLMSDIEPIVTAAFAKLRFSPGKIDGVAVKCQLQIEVSLENADQPPLQRLPLR